MSHTSSPIPSLVPKRSSFHWYMGGQFAWFISAGLQFVALQAIGALMLNLSPSQLGLVQACFLLPSVLFMLPAGVATERNDIRLLLLRLQGAAALPTLALAMMVLSDKIDFTGLMIYALLAGVLNAFNSPVRDTLVSYIVVPSQIQRAVNLASGLQFAGNMIGMAAIGLTAFIDIGYIILCHSVFVSVAAYTTYKLPANLVPSPTFLSDNVLAKRRTQMMDGLRFALRDKKIAPVVVMMLAMSLFYWGSFFVFVPLLVRDYYQGGAADIAIINALFWAGMMIASFVMLRIGLIRNLGTMVAGSIFVGLVVLFLLSIPGVYLWVWVLCFVWGLGVGVFMTSSRTIIQAHSPESYRGRLMSIYQLAFMAGFPLGALLFGGLADVAPNLHHTPFAPLIGMTVVLVFACFFSPLLAIKLDEPQKINE